MIIKWNGFFSIRKKILGTLLIDTDTESVKTYLRNVTGLIKPCDKSDSERGAVHQWEGENLSVIRYWPLMSCWPKCSLKLQTKMFPIRPMPSLAWVPARMDVQSCKHKISLQTTYLAQTKRSKVVKSYALNTKFIIVGLKIIQAVNPEIFYEQLPTLLTLQQTLLQTSHCLSLVICKLFWLLIGQFNKTGNWGNWEHCWAQLL